ncbi:hypothetical protein C0992_004997, partial [Termitomyces sp. T32_za158]
MQIRGLTKALQWLRDEIGKKAQRLLLGVISSGPIPKHVSFIMDGNRRYARSHDRTVQEGHDEGFLVLGRVETVPYMPRFKDFSDIKQLQMLEICYQLNIKCVSVFAFAIDNFNRPKDEVEALMNLAEKKLIELSSHGSLLNYYGVRLNVVGNIALLPESVKRAVRKAEHMTRHNDV